MASRADLFVFLSQSSALCNNYRPLVDVGQILVSGTAFNGSYYLQHMIPTSRRFPVAGSLGM